jgi:hypothetical protein
MTHSAHLQRNNKPLLRLFFMFSSLPQGHCDFRAHILYDFSSCRYSRVNMVAEGQDFNYLNSSKWNYSVLVMLTFLRIMFDQNKLTGWCL